jgi:hypothetical protein
MAKINIEAIQKNDKGLSLKVYEFEMDRVDGRWLSTDIELVKNTLQSDSTCVFYHRNPLGGQLDDATKTFDFGNGKVRISEARSTGKVFLSLDNVIWFKSISWSSDEFSMDEAAKVLRIMDKLGVVYYVKSYLKIKEDELKGYQSLGNLNENANEKLNLDMRMMISHIASLKHWLLLNDH